MMGGVVTGAIFSVTTPTAVFNQVGPAGIGLWLRLSQHPTGEWQIRCQLKGYRGADERARGFMGLMCSYG